MILNLNFNFGYLGAKALFQTVNETQVSNQIQALSKQLLKINNIFDYIRNYKSKKVKRITITKLSKKKYTKTKTKWQPTTKFQRKTYMVSTTTTKDKTRTKHKTHWQTYWSKVQVDYTNTQLLKETVTVVDIKPDHDHHGHKQDEHEDTNEVFETTVTKIEHEIRTKTVEREKTVTEKEYAEVTKTEINFIELDRREKNSWETRKSHKRDSRERSNDESRGRYEQSYIES